MSTNMFGSFVRLKLVLLNFDLVTTYKVNIRYVVYGTIASQSRVTSRLRH